MAKQRTSPFPSASRVRRAGVLAGALAALLAATLSPGSARAALPDQGLYEQCAPSWTHLDCNQRLQTMGAAGFRYVLNYTAWRGTAAQVRRYADQAAAAGLKVIWPLNHPAWRDGTDLKSQYPDLAQDCSTCTNGQFKQYAIGLVKNHPATWGFYIGDEVLPTASNVTQVAALAQEVKLIAPNKPTLYVTMDFGGGMDKYLDPFAPLADVAGGDYYPVGSQAPNLGGVAPFARDTRRIATRHGKQAALVLQAFSWSQYIPERAPRFPTGTEMRTMRDDAIRHGDPNFLLWYSYNDLFDYPNAEAHWKDLRAAAFAPHIRLNRLPRRCAGSRVKFGVDVRTAAPIRKVRIKVGRKLVRKTSRTRFKVRASGLRKGRTKIRAVAIDKTGNRSRYAVKVKRCK